MACIHLRSQPRVVVIVLFSGIIVVIIRRVLSLFADVGWASRQNQATKHFQGSFYVDRSGRGSDVIDKIWLLLGDGEV